MFVFGDKINLDVHPFAGSIGMDGCYDCHPNFSAFLMAYHKYGIFALVCVYAWKMSQPPVLLVYHEKRQEDIEMLGTSKAQGRLLGFTYHIIPLSVLFLFSGTGLGLHVMLQTVTRHHPFEQASAMTLLVGTFGTLFSLLHVVHFAAYQFWNSRDKKSRFIYGGKEDSKL